MSMTKLVRFSWVLGVLVPLAAGCGGREPPPEVPVTNVPPAPTGPAPQADALDPEPEPAPAKPKPKPKDTAGFDKEHPVMRCGPRDSYAYVADYECSDGKKPLGGDVRAGGASRRGNVGPNSTGHIIDLYIIPCSSGPVEVYVDMYGCDERRKEMDAPPPKGSGGA